MSLVDKYQEALGLRNVLELRLEKTRREVRDLENDLNTLNNSIREILSNLDEDDLSDFIECDEANQAYALDQNDKEG